MEKTITKGSKVSVAAACFSLYAFDALKNIGINIYLIDKYDIIKVDNKYIKVKLEGTIKKWDRKLVKRRCEYFLIEEKEERIVTIDNRFDKYDELIKLFK